MPISERFVYCCNCGFGPHGAWLYESCIECQHRLCNNCRVEFCKNGYSEYSSSRAHYNTASPPPAPKEQPAAQSLPVTTSHRLPLLTPEALVAPTITPLSLILDPAQNFASSSSISQPCTQIPPLNESEASRSQHTFTVVVPQPADLGHGIETEPLASSQSKQQQPAPSAVDDPRLKLSSDTANVLGYEHALSNVSEQCDPSEDKSAADSILLSALGRLSLSAVKAEVSEDLGTGHHGDHWAHLTTLLHQLDIQPGTLHYRVILDTCARVREHGSQSGDSRGTQESPATSSPGPSRSSGHGTGSPTSSSKRSHQQCEDSDSSQEELKRCKKSKSVSDFERSRALACLFYKVNPHIYFECANFKAKTISALGEHLRKRHVGEKGHVHCEKCCLVFKTRRERSEHRPRCRETRGPCVSKILPLKRTQGVDATQRWEETWDILFPDMRKPKDAWWSMDIICEQILLSHRKRQWEIGCDNGTDLISEALSEWVSFPPEHLPDLQRDFEFRTTGPLANNARNHPNRITEAPLQAAHSSGSVQDLVSTQRTGEGLTITQIDRDPSPSPPLDDNIRPDKDASDEIAYLDASGITISSPSYSALLQDVDVDNISGPGWPWEFETQEPQVPWDYTTRNHATNDLPPESYPHFDMLEEWTYGTLDPIQGKQTRKA